MRRGGGVLGFRLEEKPLNTKMNEIKSLSESGQQQQAKHSYSRALGVVYTSISHCQFLKLYTLHDLSQQKSM